MYVLGEVMICPDCKGHGEMREYTPGMGPGSGDTGWIVTCKTCKGLRSVPSTQDLMERIDKLEALIKKRTPEYRPAPPRGYAPMRRKKR